MENHRNVSPDDKVTVKTEPSYEDDGWIERQTDDIDHEHSIVLKIEPLEEAEFPEDVRWRIDENEAEEMQQGNAEMTKIPEENVSQHTSSHIINSENQVDDKESEPGICDNSSADESNVEFALESPMQDILVTCQNETSECMGNQQVGALTDVREENEMVITVKSHLESLEANCEGIHCYKPSETNTNPGLSSSTTRDECLEMVEGLEPARDSDNCNTEITVQVNMASPVEEHLPGTNSLRNTEEDSHTTVAVIDDQEMNEMVVSFGKDRSTEIGVSTSDNSYDRDASGTSEVTVVVSLSDTSNKANLQAVFQCSSCPKAYTTSSNLKRHLKSHSGERPYQCKFCEKSFITTDKLKNHERIHTGEKRYQCQYCEKRFIYSDKRKSHERLHTGERPFTCNFCGEAFITRDKWRQHTRHKHAAEGPYLCKFCNEEIKTKLALISHERSHTGYNPYQCKYCEVTCTSSSNLNRHIRSHTGERPYQCRFCEKAFSVRNYLTNHERIHMGHRPHQCSYCEKSFVTSSALAIHVRVHTGQRPFKCQSCEKSFVRRDALKRHERTHTGARPYQCKICDKAYTSSPHLRVHERTHSSERPYQCSYCEKGFITSDKWRIHERIHTGEKPYHCNLCEERFINSTYLRRHEKSRHKDTKGPTDQNDTREPTDHEDPMEPTEKTLQCNLCEERFLTLTYLREHEKECNEDTKELTDQCKFDQQVIPTHNGILANETITVVCETSLE